MPDPTETLARTLYERSRDRLHIDAERWAWDKLDEDTRGHWRFLAATARELIATEEAHA